MYTLNSKWVIYMPIFATLYISAPYFSSGTGGPGGLPGAPPGAPGLPPSLAGLPGMPPSSAAGLLSLAGHGLPGLPPTSLQQLMARHEHMKVWRVKRVEG